MSTFMFFEMLLVHMFEEEDEKDELDDSVLDELEGDDVADDLLDEHGLPIVSPEPEKIGAVDDEETKDPIDLIDGEEEEDVDDYDSFDDEDEM